MRFSGSSKKALRFLVSCLWVLSLLIPLSSLALAFLYFHQVKGRSQMQKIPVSVDPLDLEIYQHTVHPKLLSDYQVILDVYKREAPAAGIEKQPDILSELKERLKLIALTPSDDRSFLSAYIRDTKKTTEDFYHLGDKIGEATITDINTQENSVTLAVGKDSIKLYQDESELKSEKNMGQFSQAQEGNTHADSPPDSASKKNSPGKAQTAFKSYQDTSDPNHWYIDPSEKQYLERNVFKLAHQVKFSVATDPQKGIVGLTVDRLDTTSVLAKRGFQKGDIIKGINDIQFNSTNSMHQILTDPKYINAQSYTVTVERDGNPLTLKYDLIKNP